ncbi:LOW QUALITY PROTEIN: olfactory receptor 1L3-like [Megaptera novaeangliae]
MERANQTSSVSEFILLGLSSQPENQKPLFALFFVMYMVTMVGNFLIILAIHSDTQLQTPMYFFLSILSFDVCYTTTIVPKMLVNFLSKKKSISYAECMTQMYFFLAFANTEIYLLAAMAIDRCVAICDTFHYVTTMSYCPCVLLVAFSCSMSHLLLLLVLLINSLLFRDSSIIHHIFCDINPLLKLSCSSTFFNEIVINTEGLITLVTPFMCVIISYLIFIAVLKIPSAAGKHKDFSTCGSYLAMVTLFYGSIIYVYFRPLSSYTIKDQVAIVIYTVLFSMLNPFFYSLKNKDMKRGLRKLMSRRVS